MLSVTSGRRKLLQFVIFKRKIYSWNTHQSPGERIDGVGTEE
jgi:hypothetical protein